MVIDPVSPLQRRWLCRGPSLPVSHIPIDPMFPDSSEKWGLEKSTIYVISVFVYREKGDDNNNNNGSELEYSVCLSSFENDGIGRKLPKYRHAFHANCIEMWLFSHST